MALSSDKTRSIGLKKAYFGDLNPDGGMPAEMVQLARTLKGTASFTTEADSVQDFYCEEEPSAPVESIPSEPGLKQVKLNLIEWDNGALKKVFGGEEGPEEEVVIEGKAYLVKKYNAPAELLTVKMAIRVISMNNVVVEIPHALVTARFQWDFNRTAIAQIEVTAKALAPIAGKGGPYSVYKLGDVKPAQG